MAELSCPVCGKINSIHQNFCSHCNFPLVPHKNNFSSLSLPVKAELFPQEALKWAKAIYLQNLQLKIDLEQLNQSFHLQPQVISNNSHGGSQMMENVENLIKNVNAMLLVLQTKLQEQPEQRVLIASQLENLNQLMNELSQRTAPTIKDNPSTGNMIPAQIHDETIFIPAESLPNVQEEPAIIQVVDQEVSLSVPNPKPAPSNLQVPIVEASPWLAAYNDKPDFFADYAMEVIVTDKSFNKYLQDKSQLVILERVNKNRGMFWILEPNRIDQCLVPKSNVGVNVDNLEMYQALFECIDYDENKGKFTLIKPTLINSINSREWQVKELGRLQF
ncbi:MAG TPA: hypothetical protein VK184_25110 [Nostocaceae cyanobacterium]|nr:hypothetical protein [Nostocaceae cyanobacterium]